MSDEFGLVRPSSREMLPVPRPMALKNQSIDILQKAAPDAIVGPSIPGTRKGTVAHVKAPQQSIYRQNDSVPPRWIVFPRWQAESATRFERVSTADGFMMLAMNAFNYEMLGEAGFRTVRDLLLDAECYRLIYSDLDSAVDCLNRLADA
jgi:HprK-related kinase A